jgi:hypothetical protein
MSDTRPPPASRVDIRKMPLRLIQVSMPPLMTMVNCAKNLSRAGRPVIIEPRNVPVLLGLSPCSQLCGMHDERAEPHTPGERAGEAVQRRFAVCESSMRAALHRDRTSTRSCMATTQRATRVPVPAISRRPKRPDMHPVRTGIRHEMISS